MGLSILAAVLNVGLKAAAYRVTGSVGLLADAGESIVNLVAALAGSGLSPVRGSADRCIAHLRP